MIWLCEGQQPDQTSFSRWSQATQTTECKANFACFMQTNMTPGQCAVLLTVQASAVTVSSVHTDHLWVECSCALPNSRLFFCYFLPVSILFFSSLWIHELELQKLKKNTFKLEHFNSFGLNLCCPGWNLCLIVSTSTFSLTVHVIAPPLKFASHLYYPLLILLKMELPLSYLLVVRKSAHVSNSLCLQPSILKHSCNIEKLNKVTRHGIISRFWCLN